MQTNKLTICACSSRSFIDKKKVATLVVTLRNRGYEVMIEPDICTKARDATPDMEQIASSIILACYPRAIESLLQTLGLSSSKIIDIRNGSIPTVLKQINILVAEQGYSQVEVEKVIEEINNFPDESGFDAWYPVIDKKRCIECGKCHDFCLFGVYTIEDKKVWVQQPRNCKNNCPACARICPSKAVIFPKYEKSPINGGLEDEEQAVSVDTKALYANALRMKLQQRRAGVSLVRKDKE